MHELSNKFFAVNIAFGMHWYCKGAVTAFTGLLGSRPTSLLNFVANVDC